MNIYQELSGLLTKIAVGAASPTAQGHAITKTARENMNEKRAGPGKRSFEEAGYLMKGVV